MFVKKLVIVFTAAVIFYGCSSSVDTINLSAENRFNYALNLYNEEDYEEAINEFQSIVLQFPGNEIVDDAQYYLAMSRFKREEFLLSAYEFSKLIKNYPVSENVPSSQLMLAESYYQLSPHFSLDQSYTKSAIKEFQAFIDFFPANDKVIEAEKKINELNSKLAHKEYNSALIYEKLEYYTAALMYYNYVLETYHDTQYAPLASYNKIILLIERKREQEALIEINRFLERYPESSRYLEVEKLKSSLQDKISKR